MVERQLLDRVAGGVARELLGDGAGGRFRQERRGACLQPPRFCRRKAERKKSRNDADRLSKYLARFGLDFAAARAPRPQ